VYLLRSLTTWFRKRADYTPFAKKMDNYRSYTRLLAQPAPLRQAVLSPLHVYFERWACTRFCANGAVVGDEIALHLTGSGFKTYIFQMPFFNRICDALDEDLFEKAHSHIK